MFVKNAGFKWIFHACQVMGRSGVMLLIRRRKCPQPISYLGPHWTMALQCTVKAASTDDIRDLSYSYNTFPYLYLKSGFFSSSTYFEYCYVILSDVSVIFWTFLRDLIDTNCLFSVFSWTKVIQRIEFSPPLDNLDLTEHTERKKNVIIESLRKVQNVTGTSNKI